jgi:hypothetical protein
MKKALLYLMIRIGALPAENKIAVLFDSSVFHADWQGAVEILFNVNYRDTPQHSAGSFMYKNSKAPCCKHGALLQRCPCASSSCIRGRR